MDTEHFRDRIGEDTDPADCALCHAVSCFSCVHGYCTALEKVTVGGCMFYKDADENARQIRRCFYRLIRHERFDLLRKYVDTMAALGLMDSELESAAQQRAALEHYSADHLQSLIASKWKDTLIIVGPTDDEDTQPESLAEEYQAALPTTATSVSFDDESKIDDESTIEIDDESTIEIETRDRILAQECTYYNADAVVEYVAEGSQYELPADYAEDFTDEEAEQERIAAYAEDEQARRDDGKESYIRMPLNYFFRRIGYPVRMPRQPDPSDLAFQTMGAGIIYKAAEDYIEVLRRLWSDECSGRAQYCLIIAKWELETMIGSKQYWQYTNIGPGRMLDQCWATAEKRAKEKIERHNRRVAVGIEGEV